MELSKMTEFRLSQGPLTGMEGSIRRIDRHKRIAHLEIEMFGRTVEMKVGLEIIEKNNESRWHICRGDSVNMLFKVKRKRRRN
ncbi:MAG: hypothetical protein ACLTZM_27535 [Ruminococcus sp.]